MTRLRHCASIIFAVLLPAAVNAAAVSISDATISIKIDSISGEISDGVFFGTSAVTDDPAEYPVGLASSVNNSDPPPGVVREMAVGDSVTASVGAKAKSPGGGLLSVDAIQVAAVFVAENTGDADLDIDLLFDFSLLSRASLEYAKLETALTFASVVASFFDNGAFTTIFSAGTEALVGVDPTLTGPEQVMDILDASALPGSFFPFSLTLGAGESRAIVLEALAFADAASFANVPLSLSQIFLIQALLMLMASRFLLRRR